MKAVAAIAIVLGACGSAPPVPVPIGHAAPPDAAVHHLADPDLAPRDEPRRLIALDWTKVRATTDAEALALWRQIAPTGDDWDRKLEEIPTNLPVARALATALLREGNFRCTPAAPATHNCSPLPPDMPAPAPTATLDDPCLRRLLAMWAFGQIEEADLPGLRDPLRAIAALPPPESELVAAALGTLPEADQDGRYELVAIAAAAGQDELVGHAVGVLDEAHLVAAAGKLHVAAALEMLSAEAHRATYLAAITDDKIAPATRTQAIVDLLGETDKLPPDVRAALVTAAGASDCAVAARAARALADRGDKRYLPRRPATRKPEAMMRALCVLASYERLQGADERSLLPSYLPPRGVERVAITYDALSDTDPDGDGDPHTAHTVQLVPRDEAILPDLDDLVRAMRHCTGAVCVSNDREFRFAWKPAGNGELLLGRIEVAERPPCQDRP